MNEADLSMLELDFFGGVMCALADGIDLTPETRALYEEMTASGNYGGFGPMPPEKRGVSIDVQRGFTPVLHEQAMKLRKAREARQG